MHRTFAAGLALALLMTTTSVIAQVDGGGSPGEPAAGGTGSAAGGTGEGTGQGVGQYGGGQSGVFSIVAPWQQELLLGSDAGTAAVNAIIIEGWPSSLEEALERAMKRNPEIALAEANRRQAEMAENLAKNKAFQQVVETYKQWQFDKQSLTRTEALHQTASVSEAELLTAKQAVVKSETALQFLMGGYAVQWPDSKAAADGLPGHANQPNAPPQGFRDFYGYQRIGGTEGGTPSTGEAAGAGMTVGAAPGPGAEGGGGTLGLSTVLGGGMPEGMAPTPQTQVTERLGKPSGPIDFQEMRLPEFAQLLTERIGVPVIVDRRALGDDEMLKELNVTLSLQGESLTWNDVLTATSDTHDFGFLIRDYGVLITTQEKANAGRGGPGGLGGGGGGFF